MLRHLRAGGPKPQGLHLAHLAVEVFENGKTWGVKSLLESEWSDQLRSSKITIIRTYYVACIKCFLCTFLGKSHHEEIALVTSSAFEDLMFAEINQAAQPQGGSHTRDPDPFLRFEDPHHCAECPPPTCISGGGFISPLRSDLRSKRPGHLGTTQAEAKAISRCRRKPEGELPSQSRWQRNTALGFRELRFKPWPPPLRSTTTEGDSNT